MTQGEKLLLIATLCFGAVGAYGTYLFMSRRAGADRQRSGGRYRTAVYRRGWVAVSAPASGGSPGVLDCDRRARLGLLRRHGQSQRSAAADVCRDWRNRRYLRAINGSCSACLRSLKGLYQLPLPCC